MRKPIQLVVPAAGHGSRFREIGVQIPKPLIPILNYPMICHVIANFPLKTGDKVIIIGQVSHQLETELEKVNLPKNIDFTFVEIAGVTQGAASTCLLAEEHLEQELPLVVANSDQWLVDDLVSFVEVLANTESHLGLILTMFASDPKWSYVEFNQFGEIGRVVEKEVVSNDATVGIYGWTKASLFIESAKKMIKEGDMTNNEFYVAPTYNYLINEGTSVKAFNVGAVENSMFGLGTPGDLRLFFEKADLTFAERRANQFYFGNHAD